MRGRLTIKLPSLVGTDKFQPTGLQIQCLCGFLEGLIAPAGKREGVISPVQVITALGRNKSNWYHWIKRPGFMDWWNRALDEYFSGQGLREVHKAIYLRALGDSSVDAKLFLERFDKQYKPVTGTQHSFVGGVPPDQAEGAVERSRQRVKQVASHQPQLQEQPIIEQETKKMAICEQCKGEYEPERSTSRYCSPKCKQAAYRNKDKEVSVTPVTLTETEPVTLTASLAHYYQHPELYAKRKLPGLLNWDEPMTVEQLADAKLKANRVTIPGDWDYKGVCDQPKYDERRMEQTPHTTDGVPVATHNPQTTDEAIDSDQHNETAEPAQNKSKEHSSIETMTTTPKPQSNKGECDTPTPGGQGGA